MPRTTEQAVSGIIAVNATIPLTPYIDAASMLVTRLCAPTVTDAVELEMVERWLAAHLYAIRDPRTLREGVEGIISQIESKVDLGLDVTRYGQQAKILDSSGALARWDEQIKKGGVVKPTLSWLGSTPDETRNYEW